MLRVVEEHQRHLHVLLWCAQDRPTESQPDWFPSGYGHPFVVHGFQPQRAPEYQGWLARIGVEGEEGQVQAKVTRLPYVVRVVEQPAAGVEPRVHVGDSGRQDPYSPVPLHKVTQYRLSLGRPQSWRRLLGYRHDRRKSTWVVVVQHDLLPRTVEQHDIPRTGKCGNRIERVAVGRSVERHGLNQPSAGQKPTRADREQ